MLEPPNLSTATILASVQTRYGLPVTDAAFLPIGNDASAWAYHLHTADRASYFLKIRRGFSNEAALAVPRYLVDHGLPHLVAPLPSQSGALWTSLAEYALILYPFIAGRTGMQAGLADPHWTDFGATLKQLHTASLPHNLAAIVRRETFQPAWGMRVMELDTHFGQRSFADPDQNALADFWQARRTEIISIADRATTLGARLRAADPPLVLCHADAHTANLLIDSAHRLWIVDWDEILFAPKERDLAFVVGAADADNQTRSREQELFFKGYGECAVNRLALTYYGYEWAVQEIGDDGSRVFFDPEAGAITKSESVRDFLRLFEPGQDVAQAYQSDTGQPPAGKLP